MKMKIIFLLVLVTIIFSSISLFSWSGGGGPGDTEGTAYEILDIYHLMELSDSIVSDWNKVLFSTDEPCWHCSKHFRLMNDIDNVAQMIGLGESLAGVLVISTVVVKK
jgi:hypothetical protein